MATRTYGTMGVDWEQRVDFDRLRRERLARAKQHLAVPAPEVAQREARAGQPQRVAVEAAHLVDRHEDLAPAHRGHQAGDERVVRAAKPDDDIGQPAEGSAAAIGDRPLEQPRQAQRGLAVPRGIRPGGRRRRHG